jgi:Ca-activated chloride channel homolog
MSLDANDPRLTAYTLGELDERERAEIEAELEKNPELQRVVNDIYAMSQELAGEFEQEHTETLTREQREAIAAGASSASAPRPRKSPRFRTLTWTLAAAASIAIIGGIWLLAEPEPSDEAVTLNPSSESEHAEMLMAKLPEDAKRNLIADSNNPASAGAVDLEGQIVQEQSEPLANGYYFATPSDSPTPMYRESQVFDTFVEFESGREVALQPDALSSELVIVEELALSGQAEERVIEGAPTPRQVVASRGVATPEVASGFSLAEAQTSGGGGGFGGGGGAQGAGNEHGNLANVRVGGEIRVQMEVAPLSPDGQSGRTIPFFRAYDRPEGGGQTWNMEGANVSGVKLHRDEVEPSKPHTLTGAEVSALESLGYIDSVSAQAGEPAQTVPSTDLHAWYGVSEQRANVNVAAPELARATEELRKVDAYHLRGEDLRLLQTQVAANDGEEIILRRHESGGERGGTESYAEIIERAFVRTVDAPVSTFSIDVDTASYANARRFLNQGQLPPKDAVRIEELINYFDYDYPQPDGEHPFSVNVEVNTCPWNADHELARIGLQGRAIEWDDRPGSNLVFLIDVSGSMKDEDKLPLLKKAMALLTKRLAASDRVAIVTYSNEARLALAPTTADKKRTILAALDSLSANGGTNGAGGLQLAYDVAADAFVNDGINRVILATDGDFNVGVSSTPELVELITDKAKSGVFLSVLGFGEGNLKDSNLEALADRGNGHYAYIDGFNEARKVLLEEAGGSLVTIAKDVKIQVEFNPATVGAYRLIGYENRALAARDFADDRKDAGEIGAGHSVTALYELVPLDKMESIPGAGDLKYQKPPAPPEGVVDSDELMTVKLRYKAPDADKSTPFDVPVGRPLAFGVRANPTPDFQFASAVAGFGMLLRDSDYRGDTTYDGVLSWAQQGRGPDTGGYRAEFISLVKIAQALAEQ